MFEELFFYRKPNPVKLAAYGFYVQEGCFRLSRTMPDGEFLLEIAVSPEGRVDTALIERETGEEYVLYKTRAQGAFVGRVRELIGEELREIAHHCFDSAVFRQEQTKQLVCRVEQVYGEQPDFPFRDTPYNGILRRKDNKKWYAAILHIPKNRLGINSDETVEIVNLHATAETVTGLLCRKNFYPAWHMNKKRWFTVILDGSIESEELFLLTAESRRLVGKDETPQIN